jgi:hypothetical protein
MTDNRNNTRTKENQVDRRDAVLQELGRQMSIISEDASCSGWTWQLENELPQVLLDAVRSRRPAYYADVEISLVYADWLVSLADELGHWVTLSKGGSFVAHIPRSQRNA